MKASAIRSSPTRDPAGHRRQRPQAASCPTGDITFDSLMDRCTTDLKHRIDDIAVANRVLKELVTRTGHRATTPGSICLAHRRRRSVT